MIQQLINFLRLIRWKNILIFLLFQTIVYFRFASKDIIPEYIWFNLILVLFASAGNMQNDLYDIKVDEFNKKITKMPFVKEYFNKLKIISLLLYLLGVFISYYVFYQSKNELFSLLLIIPVLLISYNIHLKRVAIIGNLVVSGAIAFVLFLTLYFFFDWQAFFIFYTAMAFLLNIIREIVKDIEDKEGDKQANYYTLPIISMFLTHLLIRILLISFWVIMYHYLDYFNEVQKICLIIISISMIYVVKLINAKKNKKASLVLKMMMLSGILTLLI